MIGLKENLNTRNEFMMIEVLGCGSAFAPELGNSSFILWRSGEKKSGILFDCGSDVFVKLKEKNYLPYIDSVIISHLHGDHAGSLDILIYWNFYVLKRKLVVYSWSSLEEYLREIDSELPNLISTGNEEVNSQKDKIELIYVKHSNGITNSCGAIVFDKIFISGDTREVQVVNKDVVLHEVYFGNKYPGMVHTHFDELVKEIPRNIRHTYWLYHYGVGDYKEYNDLVLNAGFAGLAYQGQRLFI